MLNMAIVGYGYWGPNLVRNFLHTPDATVKVVCDARPERLSDLAAQYPSVTVVSEFQQVLDDPDIQAVAIATPVSTHFELARRAMQAGKHVLVEKPMTDSAESAEALVELADKTKRVLMVDHVFVYSAPVRRMKEILDAGELGDLYFVDSVRINLGLFQHDVNVIWDLAPHDLSIVDYLIGRAPRTVASFGAIHTDGKIEDVAYLNLDFDNGLIATFHVNWLSPVKLRHMMLGGSRKGLVYNDLDPNEPLKVYDRGIEIGDELDARRHAMVSYRIGDVWSPNIGRSEPLAVMAAHFVDCVQNGTRPLSGGVEGLRVVRILDAAQRSVKAQGGRITL